MHTPPGSYTHVHASAHRFPRDSASSGLPTGGAGGGGTANLQSAFQILVPPPRNGRYLRAPGVFGAGKRERKWVCAEHRLCAGNLPSGDLYSNPAREGRFAHLIDEETEARRWATAQLGPGLGGRSPASQQAAYVTPEVAGSAHPLPKGTVPLAQSCCSLGLFENSRSLRGLGGWCIRAGTRAGGSGPSSA